MSYSRITTATESNIQRYLNNGWILIDTTKSFHGPDDTSVTYHIGYPFSRREQDLIEIIRLYEEYDFKEKLFNRIAEKNDDKINNYDSYSSAFPSDKELPVLMSKYESTVQNKDVNYGVSRQPSWSEVPDDF